MTDGPSGTDLPVVDPGRLQPSAGPDSAGGSRAVAGVLLAAGESRRFGEDNKLLATVDGEPMVRRAARTLLAADLAGVVAVVGHEAARVTAALSGLGSSTRPADRARDAGEGSGSRDGPGSPKGSGSPAVAGGGRLALVGNPRYREGQATSVRAGVRAVCGADAAVFALGDMPRVGPDAVRALVRAYRAGAGDALAAAFEGRRGNPVLFDARHFPALDDVGGDTGGREILLSGENSALVETGDPGVVSDVDTADDLERIDGE